MAQKRKSLSTKTRFEIFKRDNFTCQYCGRKTPDVILEIDHITPVSKGGDDDIINLITSCFECNRGKSNIEIKNKKERPDLKKINEENTEREIQLKEYYKYLSRKHNSEKKSMDEICDHWDALHAYEVSLNERGRSSVKQYLKYFNKYEIMDYMDMSMKIQGVENQFKYFCGICWNIIKNKKVI